MNDRNIEIDWDYILKVYNKISDNYLLQMIIGLGIPLDYYQDIKSQILVDVFVFVRRNIKNYRPDRGTQIERYISQIIFYQFFRNVVGDDKTMKEKAKTIARGIKRDNKIDEILNGETPNT